ncbi:MAG: tRNA (adenosine(37)-N6)-threonylcarbamoyltransferase complex dimerization subunit type 1 TsaB [Phycisphaerales bacterium]|nr:tRNA (adenosine(37)-N6)-threonylcarbamoyltransferase complex dimerization subunit type 1 TsaB [Phycisphaerae bacterium]NNF42854.1 tRNA (adenosine(37)-N6)-threonylcarbamoyltransferase complex dimerization subunit type 1 TsaB [Phycisphaerales bacterium]NNM27091.1 tRNA (adenosine(37)-N6)-threonylcarbamoyltransferase complex dimerization subunit type 1 TsaB [Phycisphaerales bacterium]
MPVFLAIETSQREGGVALCVGDGPVRVEPLGGAAERADVALVPAIDRLCRQADQRPTDLDTVAVSIGPGGFTGLRLAVSVAKMLALSCGCDLVAVPSAFVVAESLREEIGERPALVILAVKGDNFWATPLRAAASGWRSPGGALGDARSVTLADDAVVIGDEHLPASVRERCIAASIEIIPPRFDPAATLAEGRRLHHAGQTTGASELLPLYPRPPEAVTLWQSRRARDAANRTAPDQ